ncbi:unnamed protein product [Meganyctiphanes norvegica]|uniref:Chitin-binding type-2 domain-containing protein n=1 Tax=Meganyctiphanes norvegica TaxID=48144 RepID=A0AAV2S3F7_MEGNR
MILAKFLFVVSLVVTSWAAFTEHPLVPCAEEISAKCPANDGANPTYFADPEDCSKFCECSGGTAYVHNCLPGLYFDATLNVCNWPVNVDCGSRPVPPSNA